MTDRNPSTPSDPSEPIRSTAPTATGVQTGSLDPADPVGSAGSGDESAVRLDVLHVEPDPRSAELLATFAAHLADGVSVRSVTGVEAALAAVDDADCVVTEQRLPDGSGVELVERLRRDGEDLPVVFHTTCREEDVEARAFSAGADAYFWKLSTRGQYERIFDRVRTLGSKRGFRRSGPAESASSTDSPGLRETVRSEE